jgi:hypothetical protein
MFHQKYVFEQRANNGNEKLCDKICIERRRNEENEEIREIDSPIFQDLLANNIKFSVGPMFRN